MDIDKGDCVLRQRKIIILSIAFFIVLCVGIILTFEIGINNIKNKHINQVYDEVVSTPQPVDALGEAQPG